MTDLLTNQLTATLEAVWGHGVTTTWVESTPPQLGGLSPLQSDLLLAGMRLLNWGFPRLTLFLKEKFAISKIQDLQTTQIDAFFDHLNLSVANWKDNSIDGDFDGASLSSLSCQYWQARLALYPHPVQASKKRKNWVLDGYQSPEYKPKSHPKPDPKPDPKPEPDLDWVEPMEPFDWYQGFPTRNI